MHSVIHHPIEAVFFLPSVSLKPVAKRSSNLLPPKAKRLKPIAEKRSSLRAVSSYELEANLMPLKANGWSLIWNI